MSDPTPREAGAPLGFLARFIRLQVERPWLGLLCGLLLTIPSVFLARKRELHTGFESLLPDNKPSVKELQRVGGRTAGVSTLVVVAEGNDKLALQKFGDAAVLELRALGTDWVGTVENNVKAEQEFLGKRRALFLSLQKIQELHDKIEDRYDYEVHGSLTGDVPEAITRATIEKELGVDKSKGGAEGPPYLDGYYMNKEGTRLITVIRTPVNVGDLERTKALRAKVEGAVAKVLPPGVTVGYTGDLITGAEQYGQVKEDLASVGAAGIGLILLVDFLFFLRIRAVVAMGLSIGVGVLWCFALTRLVIGHLNTASGFLVSIVFGNGLNYGILLRARYNEARREGASLHDAVTIAYRDTWRPTLTVAAAAGVGYVSLATTDFRGFRDFGAIGGYGMLLCWLANYLFMIPLLVVFERVAPTHGVHPDTFLGRIQSRIDAGIPYGAPFAWFARRAPALVAVLGLAFTAWAGWASYRYIRNDPMEYELWRLENEDRGQPSAASKLGDVVVPLTGRTGPDGMAIMVDKIEQVKPLVTILHARRDAAPPGQKPFEKAVSIFDLVPDQQAEKVVLLKAMRKRIDRIRELGKITDADWKEMEPFLPPADITAYGVTDLPERVARPFTEKDGTRGRIVYIAPTDGRSVRDARYLKIWADAYRETKLPSGETIIGSGRAVIFADMLAGVWEESPKAIVLSFLGTALVVAVAFTRGPKGKRAAVLVVLALAMGIAWMGGAFYFFKMKLNFLNFIAVPITFGIGVDYAINVVNRWRLDGPGSVIHTVRETGGAVVLCSLTTSLGYVVLMRSINNAVKSFGLAAVLGELTCILAALVVLPAILILLDRRAGVREQR
ncbi:MAG: MMPL family transporter [Myxococcales bacterium]|nr:MMPL family transporter [Myxococcales bacterium]